MIWSDVVFCNVYLGRLLICIFPRQISLYLNMCVLGNCTKKKKRKKKRSSYRYFRCTVTLPFIGYACFHQNTNQNPLHPIALFKE
jgi:hypothetical protein